MLKLIKCEFLKLKRKPLVFISLLLSVFMPLAYAFFLADVNTDVDAVNGVMSSLFQLSAYLLLMPLLVILASNLLFEELDNDTLKNLVTIPINRTKLVLSKMLVLLLFAVGFMAVGGLVNLAVLLFQGWEPVGFWILFGVGIEEGLIMWVGALPCILLVVLLNKNYIVSVVITFFYTTANYILSMSDAFLTQPFGLNIGTLFPGPLAFRWTFQFYDQSQTSAELADLLERISPYFLNTEYLFGGTSIKREAGKDLSIDCALEVTDGTAKVFWISEADEEVTLLETTGTYSDTITLPEGGNYIGIECENFTGSIELNME